MSSDTERLIRLDHEHVWHPFTAMRQWRQQAPLVIERGDGPYLIDTEGQRYIDGVSSLWCNLHGHRVPELDRAVREQLDKIAHTTLLGLASPPSIELAAQLAQRTPGKLRKTFYSDAGATALEVAFKMAVGYWFHHGKPNKNRFMGMAGAYHGDTTGSMSVGYSELFHKPFLAMVFPTTYFDAPDPCRLPETLEGVQGDASLWPSEDPALADALREHVVESLRRRLEQDADRTAAIVVEPIMQGAAGMIPQPPGLLSDIAALAREHDVLLIADEVAVGFGRTGTLFACQQENVEPDLLCLAKGISAGYLPLAATVVTDEIDEAFCGEPEDRRTLYHGHTYTGNPLACAVALESLALVDRNRLLDHIDVSAGIMKRHLNELREHPNVLDVRQRGVMVGIELCKNRQTREPFDFSKRTAAALCEAMRPHGLIVRPLGDVLILMPIPAMPHDVLDEMMRIVVRTLKEWRWE